MPRGRVFQLRNMMRLRGENVQLRILRPGTSGTGAIYDLYPCRALVKGYNAKQLVGGIVYGERHAIILSEHVAASGLNRDLVIGDWITVRNRVMRIASLDDSTYRDHGTLFAVDMKVTG